jgi:hypothetical protein
MPAELPHPHLPLVGPSQVSHEPQLECGYGQRAQARQRRREGLGPESQAIHARVDLDPQRESLRTPMRLE